MSIRRTLKAITITAGACAGALLAGVNALAQQPPQTGGSITCKIGAQTSTWSVSGLARTPEGAAVAILQSNKGEALMAGTGDFVGDALVVVAVADGSVTLLCLSGGAPVSFAVGSLPPEPGPDVPGYDPESLPADEGVPDYAPSPDQSDPGDPGAAPAPEAAPAQ